MKLGATVLLMTLFFSMQSLWADSPMGAKQRNYPGGRDDSDLTVQTLRQITKKGAELEDPENFEPEGTEYESISNDSDFGE